MNIGGIELPAHYNGVGLHDTPGTWAASFNRAESQAHAQLLREHGVTTYKLLAEGPSKLERARAYVEAGIVPVVRFYVEKPWGRGNYSWVTPPDQILPYYDAGVRLFELGFNELNIDCEWVNGIGGQTAHSLAVEGVNAWSVALGTQAQLPGAKMLFTSMTPGGNIDHRAVYREVVNEIVARGMQSSLEHMAVHIRSHNVPPSFKLADNPTMTISWAEQFWIADLFAAAGMRPYLWSTEFGPAPFDDPPTGYPQLDYNTWVEYAWEEFLQMNPAHVYPASPQLAGIHHWYEAAWGHPGAWTKDSLRDSQDTRVPAPTHLWTRMAERVGDLGFLRYENGEPEPPDPPGEVEDGIDVSYAQAKGVNWDAAWANGNRFAYLRAGIGLTMDTALLGHFDQCQYHTPDMDVGAYWFLSNAYDGKRQARLFAALCGYLEGQNALADGTGDFLLPAVDVEATGLTAAKVREFVTQFYKDWHEYPLIYTRASFWNKLGDLSDISAVCPLWIAHYDVDKPTLPVGWSDWAIWQYGVKLGPEFPTAIDRDRRKGGAEPPDPPDPPSSLRILDASGQLRDWDWLTETFGLTAANVEQGDLWRVTQLQEGGPSAALLVYGPPGTVVTFGWPDGSVQGPVEAKGSIGFGLGHGAYYFPPSTGPHWVVVGDCSVDGLGMLGGTEHRHIDVTVSPTW